MHPRTILPQKHKRLQLLLPITSAILLFALLVFSSPDTVYQLAIVPIPTVFLFFILIFLFFFGIVGYITQKRMQGFIVGSFVVMFFLLRFVDITHPFFLVLLLLLFVVTEIFFWEK